MPCRDVCVADSPRVERPPVVARLEDDARVAALLRGLARGEGLHGGAPAPPRHPVRPDGQAHPAQRRGGARQRRRRRAVAAVVPQHPARLVVA